MGHCVFNKFHEDEKKTCSPASWLADVLLNEGMAGKTDQGSPLAGCRQIHHWHGEKFPERDGGIYVHHDDVQKQQGSTREEAGGPGWWQGWAGGTWGP